MAKRKDLLNVPMTIEWSRKHNRKYFLEYLIKENNYSTMAEVGVRDGRTTFYLLDACPELTIYAIDLSTEGFLTQEVVEKYGDRLIPIQGISYHVYDKIPKVDLVFIDADHSYNGVSRDIQMYRTKISKNGMLTGHDIDYPGVNRAVNELVTKYDVGPNNVWFTSFVS